MILDLIYIPLIMVLGLGFINLFSSQLTERDQQVLRKLLLYNYSFSNKNTFIFLKIMCSIIMPIYKNLYVI